MPGKTQALEFRCSIFSCTKNSTEAILGLLFLESRHTSFVRLSAESHSWGHLGRIPARVCPCSLSGCRDAESRNWLSMWRTPYLVRNHTPATREAVRTDRNAAVARGPCAARACGVLREAECSKNSPKKQNAYFKSTTGIKPAERPEISSYSTSWMTNF